MSRDQANAAVRLQKVLAEAGVGSRRACEELIEQRRVSVNGEIVRQQGVRVNPAIDIIHVDGERVAAAAGHVVLAFNKPAGVVTTLQDELGRPCVGDYLTQRTERLFHIGRLDADTEGLLLLTNDGQLANHVSHPRHGVPKTYVVTVAGVITREAGRLMTAGIELDDGPAKVDGYRLMSSVPGTSMIEVVIHEGRKHIVRRMFDEVGFPVQRLVRTKVGPIRLGDQRPGTLRTLSTAEAGSLYASVGL